MHAYDALSARAFIIGYIVLNSNLTMVNWEYSYIYTQTDLLRLAVAGQFHGATSVCFDDK